MNKVIVDKARLLRRVIVISWISLALCFVIKIFGGNFFEIMCENPNYKALCEYADTHFWLKYLLGLVSSIICQSLFILSIIQQYKFTKKQFFVVFISVIIATFVKMIKQEIGVLFDIYLTFILPTLFLGKNFKKYIAIIVANLFIFAFQIISLFVKNLAFVVVDDSTFIGLIYMIDMYLMCVLYYLYRNYEKEKKEMGIFWVYFAGKPADKLRAMKAKREAKIKKLEAEINAIEIELSKKKDEK
jgi:hypothetical protein